MKAITLTEPWATAIALGVKRIEARSWKTDYRGPIAIHAARGMTSADVRFAISADPLVRAMRDAGESVWKLGARHTVTNAFGRTRGHIIAIATLAACLPTNRTSRESLILAGYPGHEFDFGDYSPGRYLWLLRDVVRLPEPMPAVGQLGLWEYDGAIVDHVLTRRSAQHVRTDMERILARLNEQYAPVRAAEKSFRDALRAMVGAFPRQEGGAS